MNLFAMRQQAQYTTASSVLQNVPDIVAEWMLALVMARIKEGGTDKSPKLYVQCPWACAICPQKCTPQVKESRAIWQTKPFSTRIGMS